MHRFKAFCSYYYLVSKSFEHAKDFSNKTFINFFSSVASLMAKEDLVYILHLSSKKTRGLYIQTVCNPYSHFYSCYKESSPLVEVMLSHSALNSQRHKGIYLLYYFDDLSTYLS